MIETQSYTESLSYIESLIEVSPLQSDKALVLMNKIIQVFPKHCLALEIIGNIYFQQENFIQALHYYNQCVDHLEEAHDVNFLDNLKEIQSNPESTSQNKASLIIAKILTKSQQKEEALSIISTLANTDVDIDANLLKISVLNQLKDFNQSQDLLSELVKKQPFQWNIHTAQKTTFYEYISYELSNNTSTEEGSKKVVTKAALLLANQELSKAIKLLQKVPVNDPLYFDSQQMIARAFFELSRYDLAIQIYERLVKSSPDYPNIKALYYWTGLSQLLLSNEEDALQSFETLATYDQNFLQTTPIITQLQKQKFLNHNGLVATGCLLKNDFQIIIRKNHFGPQKRKITNLKSLDFLNPIMMKAANS